MNKIYLDANIFMELNIVPQIMIQKKRGKCGKVCFDKRTAQSKRNSLLNF